MIHVERSVSAGRREIRFGLVTVPYPRPCTKSSNTCVHACTCMLGIMSVSMLTVTAWTSQSSIVYDEYDYSVSNKWKQEIKLSQFNSVTYPILSRLTLCYITSQLNELLKFYSTHNRLKQIAVQEVLPNDLIGLLINATAQVSYRLSV